MKQEKKLVSIRNNLLRGLGRVLNKIDRRCQILCGYLDAARHNLHASHRRPKEALRAEMLLNFSKILQNGNTLPFAPWKDKEKELKEARNLFENKIDKMAYASEIAFQAFSCTIPSLSKLMNPFSKEEFEPAKKKMRDMLDDGTVPAMHGVASHHDQEASWEHPFTPTFALQQYAYPPHVAVSPGDIFLDCGAYFGETAVWALKNGAQKVYSFEPGHENYCFLQENAAALGKDQIIPLPYGVGEKNKKTGFHKCGSASSITDDANKQDYIVEIVSLDSWCIENKVLPSFIKMDIEGSELKALRGAKNIIQTYKPKLAVCLYHKAEDMWEIPLFIKEICREYSFYCRKNYMIGEFVLYAAVK